MLPTYYDGMHLPEGDHLATWDDVIERFSGTDRRRAFCGRLRAILLRAKRCGFLRVYVFGSFVSAKDEPGDVDLLWVYEEGLNIDSLDRDCRDLLNYETMKQREGWDMFCCSNNGFVINYLTEAWRKSRPPESRPRGVIIIELVAL